MMLVLDPTPNQTDSSTQVIPNNFVSLPWKLTLLQKHKSVSQSMNHLKAFHLDMFYTSQPLHEKLSFTYFMCSSEQIVTWSWKL